MMGAAEIAQGLPKAQKKGAYWMACCPAHEDRNPSLSISEVDGKTLFKCHAGCSQEKVIDALRAKGLWSEGRIEPERLHKKKEDSPVRYLDCTYDYHDESGALLYQTLRYVPKGPFPPRRPNGHGWVEGVKGVRRVPYRLPEILAADRVVLCEGEKDVDALMKMGVPATTKPGFIGSSCPEGFADHFRGKQVFIVPDADIAGRDKGKKSAEQLFGVAASVHYCSEVTAKLGAGADVYDWLHSAQGPKSAEAVWAKLDTFKAETAPEVIDETNLLTLRRADTLQAKLANDDIIEDLLIAGQMSVVYGPSNTGKSFVVTDLALHMALGMRWQERAVERGAVIYVAAEGSYGITNRVVAFRQDRQISGPLPFFIHDRAINLFDDGEIVQRVIDTIRVTERNDQQVQLLVIDTLSRVMAGGDENTVMDMQQVVDACDQIRNETGVHVMLVHHTGKDTSRGARGSSALRASTDTEIEIDQDDDTNVITAKVTKQRDLEVAGQMACALRVVELGKNPRGKTVTSCVVEPREVSRTAKRPKSPRSANAKICFEALTNAMPELGTARRINDQTVKSCLIEEWYAQVRPVLTMDARHKRQAFDRSVNSLSANRFIGVNNEVVWIEK